MVAPKRVRRCDPDTLRATEALLAAGWSLRQIAAGLHYSRVHVTACRDVLRAEGRLHEPRGSRERIPWHNPGTRAGALDRGRALVVAKVAAGEWVLPKGNGR
jgi:hypothetical protein